MAPISELRGAIPYAYLYKETNLFLVYLIAVVGNLIPVIPLLLTLEPISNFLRKNRIMDKFFNYIFEHARRRSKLVEKYEAVGLTLFVAIPLPITGAWTGSIIAYLLKIKFKYAFIAIAIGVMLAGIIVSLVCLGIVHIPIFLKH